MNKLDMQPERVYTEYARQDKESDWLGRPIKAGWRFACAPFVVRFPAPPSSGNGSHTRRFCFLTGFLFMANGLNYKSWRGQLHDAEDALQDRPPMDYIVKNVIPLPSLNMFYGTSGTLKTNLILDMAVCVALGRKWLTDIGNKNGYETKKNPVLWVDADSGIRALDIRIGAMLRAYKGNRKTPIIYTSFLSPAFEAGRDPKAIIEMIELIKDYKSHMIVFDNLGTFSGGKDEITSQMIQVMSNFRLISEKTSSAVILIHHEPKNESGRRTPRGHTSIEAALDYGFGISRESDVIQIESTKARHWNVDPFAAMWTYEHKSGTPDLREARFFGVEPEVPEKIFRARTAVLDYLKEEGRINQSELIEYGAGLKPKVSKTLIISELTWLITRGKVLALPARAHNEKKYELAK